MGDLDKEKEKERESRNGRNGHGHGGDKEKEKKNGRSSNQTSKDDSANESDSKHYTTSSGRKYKKFLNGHKDEMDRDSDDVRKVKSHSRERYERNSRDRDRSDNNK